jgi:hypothetical protein
VRTTLLVAVVLLLFALPPLVAFTVERRMRPPRLRPSGITPFQQVRQDFRLSTADYVAVENAVLSGAAAPGPLRRPAAQLARQLRDREKPLAGRARAVLVGVCAAATLGGVAAYAVVFRETAQRGSLVVQGVIWACYLALNVSWTRRTTRRRRAALARAVALNSDDTRTS